MILLFQKNHPMRTFLTYTGTFLLLLLHLSLLGCPTNPPQENAVEKTSTQESAQEAAAERTQEASPESTAQEPVSSETSLPDASPERIASEPLPEKTPTPEEVSLEKNSPEAQQPESLCGNKQCDTGETNASCPQDCPPLIWKPKPGTTWHWQLTGKLDTSVNTEMYDIDLFDHTAQTIASLKNQKRTVICYFSAGSYEDWRPDKADFPAAVKGQKMDGWDELWLDIRATSVRDIMKKRLDLAKQKGCDGVEPDNVDGYTNKTGFPLTAQNQLDFNRFLAKEAHQRGLSIGLKNDLDQIKQLVGDFDWALNEECLSYNECNLLQPFLDAGKAVFHVEYDKSKAQVCTKVPQGFSSMIKHWDLDAWSINCW